MIDAESFLANFNDVTGGKDGQYQCRCPAHEDNRASLSIKVNCEKVALHCKAGCKTEAVVEAAGLEWSDLFSDDSPKQKPRTVCEYEYRDEDCKLLFEVVRRSDKTFPQRRWVDGKWVWKLGDVRRVLYRTEKLCKLPEGSSIVVAEGEKDVHTLERMGFHATCSSGGAGNWLPEHAEQLRGHNIAVLQDNDDPGREHALQVADSLIGVAARVRRVELDGLSHKGDVTDWHEAGGTREKFIELVKATPDHVRSEQPAKSADNEKPADTIYKPATVGETLNCGDRGNRGEVVEDCGDSCEMHFVSPDGNEATKRIPKEELSRLDGTPLAEIPAQFPKVMTFGEMRREYTSLRPPVIHGVVRKGETGNLISVSKLGKSFLVGDLALSVLTDRPWLGFDVEPGNVLILDNELHPETLTYRIDKIATSNMIPPEEYDHLKAVNFRGELVDIFALQSFFSQFKAGELQLVIIDALYRFMPEGIDENSNAGITKIYNQLDRYAAQLDCAIVCVHHASKGNQSGKAVVDVGSGAGAQSRATDAHLVLRPHKEDNAAVLEAACRSWPPIEPRVLRWNWPLWELADDLNPADLKSERGQRGNQQAEVEAMKKNILDTFAHFPDGATKTDIRGRVGQGKAFNAAWLAVCNGGDLEECEIRKGNNKPLSAFKKVYPEGQDDGF